MPDQPLPDSDDRLVGRLLARIHRKPLRPVEEARGLRTLMTSRGWTGERLATELRIPESRVSRSLSLLRLPSDVQDQVDRSEIPPSTVYEITKVADPEDQVWLAEAVVEHGATCEEVRDQVCLIAKKSRRKKKVRVVHTFRVGGCKIVITGLTRYDQAAMALALRRGAASVERELAGGADAQAA